jgi:hypothetical protein
MPGSRKQQCCTSRIALLLALGTGLSQGASTVASYMTGLDGRLYSPWSPLPLSSLQVRRRSKPSKKTIAYWPIAPRAMSISKPGGFGADYW